MGEFRAIVGQPGAQLPGRGVAARLAGRCGAVQSGARQNIVNIAGFNIPYLVKLVDSSRCTISLCYSRILAINPRDEVFVFYARLRYDQDVLLQLMCGLVCFATQYIECAGVETLSYKGWA
jgi:hypothetical protein